MIGLLLWLGCPDDPTSAPDRPAAPTSAVTGDTGPPPPPCVAVGPCSAELAVATWGEGATWSWTGYELTQGEIGGEPMVIVGSPKASVARASVLRAETLDLVGSWADPNEHDTSETSNFGETIGIRGDGERIAVGARSAGENLDADGVVYVFDRLPGDSESPATARLTLIGDYHHRAGFGGAVAFLDLSGSDTELVVGTANVDSELPSAIFRFDPDIVGSHGVDSALATITGAPILGQKLGAWDADGDGLDELVTSADYGVIHFPAPWVGDLLESDADVVWSERDPVDQLADTIEVLDDLDGDGQSDLAITANTFSAVAERAGAAYLVPAGPLASMPAEELPYRFHGTEIGEGMGSAATSGDYDGDGHADLVLGAYGLLPGEHAGKILGYLGPLSHGTRTAADADFVVHGEHVMDTFGAEAVTVDADGDARDDLVVSAQNWDGRGKVYLLLGRDLLP